jgi:N-acetyl sugar amidotransferase
MDYRVCSRCVMDTTDPYIMFDQKGVCNHCHRYDQLANELVFTGDEGRQKLNRITAKIKADGSDRQYDCIIGVSGGVDSTFAAYKVKELGLRPLAIHLDNGWDSELAVSNIEKFLKQLNIDLHTHVMDWEEFKDLQLAFLRASTPDSEIPTDHAIVSLLYQIADEMRLKYVITGINIRTETHLPDAWSRGHADWKYIDSVHRRFGRIPLKTYPHRSRLEELRYRRKQKWVSILDYVDYVKKDAIRILQEELGWQYYGGKHQESIYTRFFQGYVLPTKFGVDKRKMHLSSLICSGEMSREEAMEALKTPPYAPGMLEADRTYVLKKLDITEEGLRRIMELPKKTIFDYPSYARDDQRLLNRMLLRTYRAYYKWRKSSGPGF